MCIVAVDHPSNYAVSAAELPSVARVRTHWIRWYCEWLLARLSLWANRSTVALSPTIRLFIHVFLKFGDEHHF
jgi:hypothetical protein